MAANDVGTGFKKDDGKVRLELLPPEFIIAVGTILTFGAVKYPYRNWEHGMSWGRVFGALMRHLWAWWGGAQKTKSNFAFGDLDSETGYSHLWHAACCMAFLVTYEERQIGRDDRPSTTMEPEPKPASATLASTIIPSFPFSTGPVDSLSSIMTGELPESTAKHN